MPVIKNYEPPLVMDLRDKTLDLDEPGIRVIDAKTGEHVASILPDERGTYDAHAGSELAAMIRSHQSIRHRGISQRAAP